ncbi:MAG: YqeG family HAD IIIA-type phosphatase [Lachnospiraceae bacterium]|nr:YqeG family HAD IIIA-type phosphatase [Lachnospiraceae bacterium]
MFKYFYPDEYVDSAYGLDYESFFEAGYRAVLFDIDNTLVPHGAPATQESIELFERLRKIGFKACLISNNKIGRVKSFADKVGAFYIEDAHKPSRKGYTKAMEEMGTTVDNTLFVGDQLFTDVWGAKRCGIKSILVKPINPKEEIQIVLKRYPERLILHSYKKSHEDGKK